MADPVRIRHDRHLRLAAKLTDSSNEANQTKFLRPVLLMGEAGELATHEGRLLVLAVVNLIARYCPRIDLSLPGANTLATDSLSLARRIDSTGDAHFRYVTNPDTSAYAAVVHVGRAGPPELHVTNVLGRGWLASVSSTGAAPSLAPAPYTPFGPVLAACFGAAEVFKRLLHANPEKVALWGPTVFSAYSYAVGEHEEVVHPGPVLSRVVPLPHTLLAGAGAVGNAVAYVLSKVEGIRGGLAVADKERLGDEDDSNLNRYSLAFEEDVAEKKPKVDLVTAAFVGTNVTVTPFPSEIAGYLARVFSGDEPRPVVVVSAVDNNDIRPSLQRLWPDCLLEGATADSLFQVSRHVYADGLACLMCIHSEARGIANRSPEDVAAEITGLHRSTVAAALRDAERVLTETDVAVALADKQASLRERLGERVCTVLAEAARLSTNPNAVPRAPTVSFVSMAAGALAAAELVKYASVLPPSLETLYQMDMFMPAFNAILIPSGKSRRCECYTRRDEHDAYRALVARRQGT